LPNLSELRVWLRFILRASYASIFIAPVNRQLRMYPTSVTIFGKLVTSGRQPSFIRHIDQGFNDAESCYHFILFRVQLPTVT
jgi:hypothetical protein